MIVVKVTKTSVTVNGHAGYAKSGSDIICAAVSFLAENLVNSMDALTDDKIKCRYRDGCMDIYFENLSEQGMLLVDSFFVGICGLIHTYGDKYVKIA